MVQSKMASNRLKIEPFHNVTLFDHLKTRRVRFSDPHCTFNLQFVPDLAEALDCDGHFWRECRREWDLEPLPAGDPGQASARNSGSGPKSRTWEPERAVPVEPSCISPCWRWGRWEPTTSTYSLKSFIKKLDKQIKNFAMTSKTWQEHLKLDSDIQNYYIKNLQW